MLRKVITPEGAKVLDAILADCEVVNMSTDVGMPTPEESIAVSLEIVLCDLIHAMRARGFTVQTLGCETLIDVAVFPTAMIEDIEGNLDY